MPEKWPEGVIYKKHKRKGKKGEIEEVSVPYIRVRYTGADGKRHAIWKQVENPAHARRVRANITARYEAEGEEAFAYARKTFNELSDEYEKHYLHKAVFVDGRKVSGMRSLKPALSNLKVLREHFGNHRLRSITYGQIELFKAERLATPVISRKKKPKAPKRRPRTVAAVQRELQLLRAMLNYAVRERWLRENPFTAGKGLISSADERQRERILTKEEEARLLETCGPRTVTYRRRGKEVTHHDDGEPRRHLRALIICALDTGLRFGEMRRMTWAQVDFALGLIYIESTHTKTLKPRTVGMSKRLQVELRGWRKSMTTGNGPSDLVFGIHSSVKTAWAKVRELAGLQDVRLHDLRHTYATRIERSKRISTAQLGRLLGHTNPRTTYRYVNQDTSVIDEATRILDELHEEASAKRTYEPVN
jgi:integrase